MQKAVQKEQRQIEICLSLKKLDYLSRAQLQVLHDLGTERNAQRILREMDPYLSSFRDGQNIYYLSKEGRDLVDCKKIRKKTPQARHYIMRNSLYIAYGCPSSWKNEMKIGVKGKVTVICDALFTLENRYHIVEVDHTQKMSKNRSKIDRYKKLIDLDVFQVKPMFIWITTTDYRRKQLLNLCKGLDVNVFTISDFY